MINVTKPFLPPRKQYEEFLEGIWKRNWLTNNGPLVNDLEMRLKEYLGLNHTLFLSNGTIALQIAIRALDLKGEIITTPFSYAATTNSIIWQGCKPIFSDIDENTLNIDPAKIEQVINKNTTGILATHVYGNPCDINQISNIASKYNLKVIYDGAHAFGSKYNGKSIFQFGDVTTTSFHATKLFHTIEGGAVFTNNSDLLKTMALMRNFGHDGFENFSEIGINGKNSEFHAAMGLVNLKYIDEILISRKRQHIHYEKHLKNLDVKTVQYEEDQYNYSYYPIIFKDEESLLKAVKILQENWIFPRRYFYPPLNKLPHSFYVECPIADNVSKKVLCLPLYYDLSFEEIELVARLLLRSQNN